MQMLTDVVSSLALVVSSVALVIIGINLSSIRELISIIVFRDCCNPPGCDPGNPPNSPSGIATWTWNLEKGEWILHADLSAPGYVPVPPKLPGSIDKQNVNTKCEPEAK